MSDATAPLTKADQLRAFGAMAERIAHDFGNYLEAASAATTMLEKPSASDPERRARWIDVIRTTVDEGRSALAELRTLSFISSPAPRLVATDLAQLATRALGVAQLSRPDAKDIDVSIEAASDVYVAASERDLLRAIVNVAVNAIDAMRDGGGTISARLEAGPDVVRLGISDTGVGIPEPDRERIFAMYYSTKAERGSGIGLTLAREVAVVHGGGLTVESVEGEGTTFTFTLPRADAPAQPAARSSPSHIQIEAP